MNIIISSSDIIFQNSRNFCLSIIYFHFLCFAFIHFPTNTNVPFFHQNHFSYPHNNAKNSLCNNGEINFFKLRNEPYLAHTNVQTVVYYETNFYDTGLVLLFHQNLMLPRRYKHIHTRVKKQQQYFSLCDTSRQYGNLCCH